MRYILISFILSTTLFSCSKDKIEEESTIEDIQVIAYATHHNDTSIIASTNIIRLKMK